MPNRCSTLSRWTIRCAIATWVSMLVWILVFALFWRIKYALPHAAWAGLSIVTVATTCAATILLGLWQAVRGPRRTWALAWLMLGSTPIVWFAMFFVALFVQATSRTMLLAGLIVQHSLLSA